MATQKISKVMVPVVENPICIHAITGRAPKAKMCVHNHECATCPFDQMLEDMAHVGVHSREATMTAKAA